MYGSFKHAKCHFGSNFESNTGKDKDLQLGDFGVGKWARVQSPLGNLAQQRGVKTAPPACRCSLWDTPLVLSALILTRLFCGSIDGLFGHNYGFGPSHVQTADEQRLPGQAYCAQDKADTHADKHTCASSQGWTCVDAHTRIDTQPTQTEDGEGEREAAGERQEKEGQGERI
jgi:hypothetical protein